MAKDGAKKAKPAKTAKSPKATKVAKPAAASLPNSALPKAVRKAERRVQQPFAAGPGSAEVLDRLWETVNARREAGDVERSHSARLLARGTAKVVQKLGEEAVECVIEAALGRRDATILESADLLYHLIVVWVDAGIQPGEVWRELARRQGISGLAEKAGRPRALIRSAGTGKLP
jgi:phosphoribosyl-ATP pyrophosphohydrolase